MPYSHSYDLVSSAKLGEGGLKPDSIAHATRDMAAALARLQEHARDKTLDLLAMPARRDDLDAVRKLADAMLDHGTTDLVLLGTGGSSLGAQAIAQLADFAVPGLGLLRKGPRFHAMDNLDPLTFSRLLDALPLKTTRFLAVSKSGATGETLMQTIAVIDALKRAGMTQMAAHIFGLSEPEKPGKRNALRALLEPMGVNFLLHETGIGGRYSVLTNVGLLPAALLGLDIEAIRKGAAHVLDDVLGPQGAQSAPVIGAALNLAAMREGRMVSVMMAYADRLEKFTRWWVQLWAESLGKQGQGSQPVGALGPVDQHSQQQLYLAGPRDKLFTVITVSTRDKGPRMNAGLANAALESGFAGKTIGDLVAAQGLAMVDTFAKNGRPVRRLHCDQLDEETLGALVMHFMLETILTGYAMGIDPFDQPAVEEAKILAKSYLAEGKGA